MNNRQIKKIYGGCEVTISFGERNPNVRDTVLWLMTENYLDRIKAELSSGEQKLIA